MITFTSFLSSFSIGYFPGAPRSARYPCRYSPEITLPSRIRSGVRCGASLLIFSGDR